MRGLLILFSMVSLSLTFSTGFVVAQELAATLSEKVPTLLVAPTQSGKSTTLMAKKDMRRIVVGIPNDIFSTYSDGKPTGVIGETVQYVLRKMGYLARYRNMPKKMMRKAVHGGAIDVGTSLLKFPSREKKARYSDPIITEYSVLVVRKGEAFEIRETSDLRGKTLAGRKGFRYSLIEGDDGITIERNRTDGENIRRVLLGKVDAAIVGAVSDIFDLRAEGVMVELEVLDRAVGSVDLGAALADERFSKADIQAFNEKLAALKSSRAWRTILERNAVADLVKKWPLIKKSKK